VIPSGIVISCYLLLTAHFSDDALLFLMALLLQPLKNAAPVVLIWARLGKNG